MSFDYKFPCVSYKLTQGNSVIVRGLLCSDKPLIGSSKRLHYLLLEALYNLWRKQSLEEQVFV